MNRVRTIDPNKRKVVSCDKKFLAMLYKIHTILVSIEMGFKKLSRSSFFRMKLQSWKKELILLFD